MTARWYLKATCCQMMLSWKVKAVKRIIAVICLSLLLMIPVAAAAAGIPADGEYSINAELSGGSGRAYVESPAVLKVKDGVCVAVITWSSPYYEYMSVDGKKYAPIQAEGNASFEVPVTLDCDMSVAALTVAMSEPHEIEYTLRLDSATIRPLNSGTGWLPYAVTGCVLAGAAAFVVFHRKRRSAR